jgi:twitching motility protein PilT
MLLKLRVPQPLYKGVGCPACNYTGYAERTAIHEIIPINKDIRELIDRRATSDQIRHAAIRFGFTSLRDNCTRLVLDGVTTTEELIKVTYSIELGVFRMNDNINDLLLKALELKASDLHLTTALPPIYRINGTLIPMEGAEPLTPEDTERLISQLLRESFAKRLAEKGEVDFSFVLSGINRFRVNVFRQRQTLAAAIRVLMPEPPSIDQLGLPEVFKDLAQKPRGLILVTGPTGSGKSTTLAAMVRHINNTRKCHILTIEDPIEYLHKHQNSIINQREVGDDTLTFANALRSALREDPDVILVGEMRDLETISTALMASETGHLVLSTLHTSSAAQTIDRAIDVFPPHQLQQVRIQLAAVLQGIICQQLLPRLDGGGRIAALEILVANDAVRNMIREGKTHQIDTVIQTGLKAGMTPMDMDLANLVKRKTVSLEEASTRCMNPELFKKYLSQPYVF